MAKYSVFGAAGAASATAATAGIMKVDNAATVLSVPRIYEWSIGAGAAAEDSNYTVQMKRQTTAGTWTGVTPSPLDPASAASKATAGRVSVAAGAAGVVLGTWGFNQRGGIRWVAVPGGELIVDRANSNGIILEYAVVQGSAVNYATIFFDE
jgi:hypothetical protein